MAVIAINGRISSGKDTIGSIIQYLLSGKNVSYSTWLLMEERNNWKIKKFAYKLKEIAFILTGVDIEKFEDQDFKNKIMPPEWNSFGKPVTYRYFLQTLGTECLRDHLNTNVWVNALFSEYTEDSKWIITDLRFPNELKKVKEKDGITIRVERPCSYCNKLKNHAFGCKNILNTHVSERALDDYSFDYNIINDSSIDDLIKNVSIILKKENLL